MTKNEKILLALAVAGGGYLYWKSRQPTGPVFIGPATPVGPAALPVLSTQAFPGLQSPTIPITPPGAGVGSALQSAVASIGSAFSSLFGGASALPPAPAPTPTPAQTVASGASTVTGAIGTALSNLFGGTKPAPAPMSGVPHRYLHRYY